MPVKQINKAIYVFKTEGMRGVVDKCERRTGKFIKTLFKDTTVKKPDSFMMEVTNLCNLRCITCAREYEYGQQMNTGSMDFERFKKTIDEVAPFAKSIGLTGLGETLLYRHLHEAVDYIHEKINEPEIFISTNANLPNAPQILADLSGKVGTVQISIDGVDEKYNEIRLKGDYGRFIENVKKISRIPDIEFIFNMVVLEKNYTQMSQVVEVAHEMGISEVQFNTFNLASVTAQEVNDYGLYISEKFLAEYGKAAELADKLGVKFGSFFDFDTAPGFQKCPYPWAAFYITWDGYLAPCCTKPFPLELNFGNVFREGVMNCINSSSFRQFRKMWYENKNPGFCNKCHYIEIPKVDIMSKLL